MLKVALLLLLPLAQEDPQVVYREGLFEEVDQGNLEKAAELYAKVLKSGAPDALKAKALLRTGFCHEKKGRRKEAEQAWRDVIERFPGESATVKVARERLSALTQAEGSAGLSLDTQVQNLILDLGSDDPKVRTEASRKLVLLGDPVVPEVRRALQHKDPMLSVGAASVLIRLESPEGVYEALKRFWAGKSPNSHEPTRVLGELLSAREEARGRFLKEFGELKSPYVITNLAYLFCSIPDPAYRKLVEDRIVTGTVMNDENAFGPWCDTADEAGFLRMIERLTATGPEGYTKLANLLGRPASQRNKGAKFRAAVADAMERWPNVGEVLQGVPNQGRFADWIFAYLDPKDLPRGPLKAWFDRGSPYERRIIIDVSAVWARHQPSSEVGTAFRQFLLERMASPEVPEDLRAVIYAKGILPATPDERQKLVFYGLQYLREYRSKPKDNEDMLNSIVERMLDLLPDDSKDLSEVMDRAFDCRVEQFPWKVERNSSCRAVIAAAALRAVKRNAAGMKLALLAINECGLPADKVELGSMLLSWPKNDPNGLQAMAAANYCQGLITLPEGEREGAWKGFRALFDRADTKLKIALAQGFDGSSDPRIDEFMREALRSQVPELRMSAISHWGAANTAEGVNLLIFALDDKAEENRRAAIEALANLRALDAVPALIRFLEGPPGDLRNAADLALQGIRKHYEERAQWQRWYDDIKKTLKK